MIPRPGSNYNKGSMITTLKHPTSMPIFLNSVKIYITTFDFVNINRTTKRKLNVFTNIVCNCSNKFNGKRVVAAQLHQHNTTMILPKQFDTPFFNV